MSVVDQIKEKLDIVDVISGYVSLTKAGRNFKGLCPFHSEKTPSFIVFPDGQSWHCFGACSTGGDVFTFVMKRENLSFPEALRLLAERAGVVLQPRSEAQEEQVRLEDRLRLINAAAAERFHELLQAPDAAPARQYLQRRGISEQTQKEFLLGYARDSWQDLGPYLSARGHAWSDLVAAGLVIERERGDGYYDRFRGRIMFPIHDLRGRVIGFGGRVLDQSEPKYMNSPQSPIFDKSHTLYAAHQARDAARERGFVVVVEGYMDALMAHQHGRKNVVASLGTALTEEQVRLIKRLSKNLILALDPDAAGNQATLRGMEVAAEVMDRQAVPVVTAQGWIRYEDQLDADIRVTSLPDGMDPDEVIRQDVARWDELVQQALPVVEYYLRAVVGQRSIETAKDKAEAAEAVLPLIREIASPVERAHYLQQLARLLRVDERTLQQQAGARKRPRPTTLAKRRGRDSGQPGLTFGIEKYILLLLLQRGTLLDSMNEALQGMNLEPLSGQDFAGAGERAIFEVIAGHLARHERLDVDQLLREAEPSLRQGIEELLLLVENGGAALAEQVEVGASRCALRLREERLRRRARELQLLQEDARAQGDHEAMRQWAQAVVEVAGQLGDLHKQEASLSLLKYSASRQS